MCQQETDGVFQMPCIVIVSYISLLSKRARKQTKLYIVLRTQQKQYTGDKGKEATEVTLKAHTRQNMQAGSRDGAAATMTVTSTRHITSDIEYCVQL